MTYIVITDDDANSFELFEDRRAAYGEATERCQHHMIRHSVSVLCTSNLTWTTMLTLAHDRLSATINSCQPCKRGTCGRHANLFTEVLELTDLSYSGPPGIKPSMQSPGTHPMDMMKR